MNSEQIIIIGASAAGISAAREIRAVNKDMPVLMFNEEEQYPYYRPMLTEYIGDDTVVKRTNFFLNPEKWYAEKNVDLRRAEKVIRIDPTAKNIETDKGKIYEYGKLILANGSSPFVPLKDALSKKNVFTIRTMNDAMAVYDLAGKIKCAAIIGGGLLGLEAASTLRSRGVNVSVIEVSDRILPRQLDEECSLILQDIVSGQNVSLILGKSIESIAGEDIATGVTLGSGETVPAEMVIFSIGVRPNVELACNSGIAVDRAVIVNEKMETSVSHIYACGDVVEFNGKNIALWMPALKQGKVAGSNAAGKELTFADESYPAVLNSFGTRIFSIGNICLTGNDGEYKLHIFKDKEKNHYKKLFFINNKLVGFILIGDISESQKLGAAIRSGTSYEDLVK
jgi:NAD(P)H-nitrite reductase large subunit